MDKDKKNIIINEIHQWKDNKLLPETYCDFLLALYTEGNQENNEHVEVKKKKKRISLIDGFLYAFIMILVIASLFTNFTEITYLMQMVILSFLLIGSSLVTAYFIRKGKSFQGPLSLTFIQLLISSIALSDFFASGNDFILGLIVISNCLVWLTFGVILRILYLSISGILGIAVFVVAIIL
ncbi:hypothetical protein FS935_12970 [Metabacillus litoralis]|uniref:DUF2157 domain-containing protein n=1 Tax=Metabacillus litoralis TaxID=152268 RepID=A0A5C6VYC0_9BACI|nr:hypothetical protein [Metabacillus litoralis]TXC89974.1 hypothetical protein FS935_12970 [Metabacillus litoralis]